MEGSIIMNLMYYRYNRCIKRLLLIENKNMWYNIVKYKNKRHYIAYEVKVNYTNPFCCQKSISYLVGVQYLTS